MGYHAFYPQENMTVLFFTKGDASTGSSRQRVWLLAERLKHTYGYDYDIIHSIRYSPWLPSLKHFRALIYIYRKLEAGGWELMYIHKSFFPWDVILLILFAKWRWNKKIIYDLDDAEWIHSPRKSRLLAKHAHAIVAGSHEILAWARKFNAHAVLIPTVVDHALYASYAVTHTPRDRATIGWVGAGRAHFRQGNCELMKPTLEALAKKGVTFRFVLIGAQHCRPLKTFFQGSSFEIIFVDELNWRDPASVARAIRDYQFDIGVMPLLDTPFNKAKCAFKAIEYMACGVPVVASKVGENAIAIEHEKTGFLATTTKEWVDALETLLADPMLRKKMGEAGMEAVEIRYSYHAMLPLYHRLLSPIIS